MRILLHHKTDKVETKSSIERSTVFLAKEIRILIDYDLLFARFRNVAEILHKFTLLKLRKGIIKYIFNF